MKQKLEEHTNTIRYITVKQMKTIETPEFDKLAKCLNLSEKKAEKFKKWLVDAYFNFEHKVATEKQVLVIAGEPMSGKTHFIEWFFGGSLSMLLFEQAITEAYNHNFVCIEDNGITIEKLVNLSEIKSVFYRNAYARQGKDIDLFGTYILETHSAKGYKPLKSKYRLILEFKNIDFNYKKLDRNTIINELTF